MRSVSEVDEHLKQWSKLPPSDFGKQVAKLLEDWGGLHHFDSCVMSRADWTNDSFIKISLRMNLATFDGNALTRLVFLAHDHCIRVSIVPCNMQFLSIMFHPRKREGGFAERHPTIHDVYKEWTSDDKDGTLALLERIDILETAIKTHRAQIADDRCIEDDDRLYEALGDGIKCDRRIGDLLTMHANCWRFITHRCEAGGPWKPYVELLEENAKLKAEIKEMNHLSRD